MSDDHLPHKTPEVLALSSALPPQTLLISSLIAALVLVVILVFVSRKKSNAQGNALLLVGPMDSGKTTIFSRLVYNQHIPTTTSLQTNASSFTPVPSKTIQIIDIPGHPRIRGQFVDHLNSAKAVAFVVDSNTVSRNGPAVAEHLHHILHALTNLPPSQAAPALAIICNKSDVLKSSSSTTSSALAINRVKTILERELEKRRVAQTGGVGVEGLGEEGETTELGGLECGSEKASFKFDDWEGGEVVFLGTSARPDESEKSGELTDDGLSSLQQWLEDLL
ncbi:hypothetical protein EST38_g7121 [Candolleomyces aberdarensis]|uniref:Signal recognition particle receptor subunit beta n=1 Tax=Candolleomyces aberdarensis TaxID=2316362 RepID=A0A4Q2DG15_9AGAR|nr:hypothetical protein EST38_g7121 [Candolleomyces aberdarensis]